MAFVAAPLLTRAGGRRQPGATPATATRPSMAAAPPSRGAALRSATAAAVLALALGVGVPAVAHAALPAPKLPPIDKANKTRCVVSSSAMGQANAARDSLLDLRECPLSAADLSGFDISGAILTGADLSGANLSGTQMSKSYVYKANLSGANLTSAILDRVTFDGSDLTGALLVNAVLSDSTFVGANLKDTDWTDVYMGEFATRAACSNKTLAGTNPVTGEDSRASLGCR